MCGGLSRPEVWRRCHGYGRIGPRDCSSCVFDRPRSLPQEGALTGENPADPERRGWRERCRLCHRALALCALRPACGTQTSGRVRSSVDFPSAVTVANKQAWPLPHAMMSWRPFVVHKKLPWAKLEVRRTWSRTFLVLNLLGSLPLPLSGVESGEMLTPPPTFPPRTQRIRREHGGLNVTAKRSGQR